LYQRREFALFLWSTIEVVIKISRRIIREKIKRFFGNSGNNIIRNFPKGFIRLFRLVWRWKMRAVLV
ncbi:hypothetical protein MEO43_19310, partial [Dolichospermum sp. ST_sed5]|nr:hypothetical protein [Dolichospermum sp. ST_sed5]MDD1467392.1 hypothetical protein [Dolichospermum sp. ST_sed5]